MTDVEVLIADGCTKAEAEENLKTGTLVFDDLEETLEGYLDEWEVEETDREEFREMVRTGRPLRDWGVLRDGENTYYIQYVL